jgi:hypothetical protein
MLFLAIPLYLAVCVWLYRKISRHVFALYTRTGSPGRVVLRVLTSNILIFSLVSFFFSVYVFGIAGFLTFGDSTPAHYWEIIFWPFELSQIILFSVALSVTLLLIQFFSLRKTINPPPISGSPGDRLLVSFEFLVLLFLLFGFTISVIPDGSLDAQIQARAIATNNLATCDLMNKVSLHLFKYGDSDIHAVPCKQAVIVANNEPTLCASIKDTSNVSWSRQLTSPAECLRLISKKAKDEGGSLDPNMCKLLAVENPLEGQDSEVIARFRIVKCLQNLSYVPKDMCDKIFSTKMFYPDAFVCLSPEYINRKDAAGNTLLMTYMYVRNPAADYHTDPQDGIWKKIIELKADLNAQNNAGETALHIAVQRNLLTGRPHDRLGSPYDYDTFDDLAQRLLMLGADPTIKDNAGREAIFFPAQCPKAGYVPSSCFDYVTALIDLAKQYPGYVPPAISRN